MQLQVHCAPMLAGILAFVGVWLAVTWVLAMFPAVQRLNKVGRCVLGPRVELDRSTLCHPVATVPFTLLRGFLCPNRVAPSPTQLEAPHHLPLRACWVG